MDTKFKLAKSRSSNRTIHSSKARNRKSLSNAEFPSCCVKKRGVFVEKYSLLDDKKSKMHANQEKHRARSKTDDKKHVLTTASNKTIGTQYHVTKSRNKQIVTKKNSTDNEEENVDVNAKNKAKYRSKTLNNLGDQVIFLQRKKEMLKTSSVFSGIGSKLTSEHSIRKSHDSYLKESHEQNKASLAKEVLEGREMKKTKRVRIDEPLTLVNDGKHTNHDSKGFNKLFVNILEDSLNDYRDTMKENSLSAVNEEYSKNNNNEIHETVANLLNITKKEDNGENATHGLTEKQFYDITDDDMKANTASPLPKQSSKLTTLKTKKLKARTVSAIKTPEKQTRKNKVIPTSYTKKEMKNTWINLFKQQLNMDVVEEPKNLYEALKVIADNKKRSQESANVEEKMRKRYNKSPDCVYKPPDVIRRKKFKRMRSGLSSVDNTSHKFS